MILTLAGQSQSSIIIVLYVYLKTFSGTHTRQSWRMSSKCKDHVLNSSLNHTAQTFPSHNKTREVSIKTRSTPASLSFKGQAL